MQPKFPVNCSPIQALMSLKFLCWEVYFTQTSSVLSFQCSFQWISKHVWNLLIHFVYILKNFQYCILNWNIIDQFVSILQILLIILIYFQKWFISASSFNWMTSFIAFYLSCSFFPIVTSIFFCLDNPNYCWNQWVHDFYRCIQSLYIPP